ncbi:MAG: TIR domain-containing protein [Chloroflexota bacterium]
MEPADDFSREIVDAINASSALVVVISPDSVASKWVQREIKMAQDQGKKIIPYVYREADLPDSLARVQYIKHDPDNTWESFAHLLGFLQKDVAVSAHITPGKLISQAMLELKTTTFAAAAEKTTGALSLPVEGNTVVAVPVARTLTCTVYYGGFGNDTFRPQDTLQLAVQLTGPFPDDAFPQGVAEHFGPRHPLRLMLVRGPLSAPYNLNKAAKSRFYGLSAEYPGEWADALEAVRQAIGLMPQKKRQIFIKGPAVFLYRLGEDIKGFDPTELFHYDRESGVYRPVM